MLRFKSSKPLKEKEKPILNDYDVLRFKATKPLEGKEKPLPQGLRHVSTQGYKAIKREKRNLFLKD